MHCQEISKFIINKPSLMLLHRKVHFLQKFNPPPWPLCLLSLYQHVISNFTPSELRFCYYSTSVNLIFTNKLAINSNRGTKYTRIRSQKIAHLKLLDHRLQFISRHIHSVKICQDITTLNIFTTEFELPERDLVVLKIRQRHLKNASLQTLGSDLYNVRKVKSTVLHAHSRTHP